MATDYPSRWDIAQICLKFGKPAFKILAKPDVDKALKRIPQPQIKQIRVAAGLSMTMAANKGAKDEMRMTYEVCMFNPWKSAI